MEMLHGNVVADSPTEISADSYYSINWQTCEWVSEASYTCSCSLGAVPVDTEWNRDELPLLSSDWWQVCEQNNAIVVLRS